MAWACPGDRPAIRAPPPGSGWPARWPAMTVGGVYESTVPSSDFIKYEPGTAIIGSQTEKPSVSIKRDPAMPTNHSNSVGAGSVLLGIAAIALAGMVGTMGLIHQIGELGPKVGDIVAFDPLDPSSRDMHARLPAMSADNRPGIACVLDVRAMHANGGSMIIEALEPRTGFRYRVHWAGARSSDDSADCGSSADLLVNLDDIEVMAIAAGGYGVPTSRQTGGFWRAAAAQ